MMVDERPADSLGNILTDEFDDEQIYGQTESVEVIGRVYKNSVARSSDYDKNFDRIWLCMKGSLTLSIQGDSVELEEGELHRVPKETTHGTIDSTPGTRVLIIRGTFRPSNS